MWKFLLGLFPWDSTEAQRELLLQEKAKEYQAIKADWKTQLQNYEKEYPDVPLSEAPHSPVGAAWDENQEIPRILKMRERMYRIRMLVVSGLF